MLLGDYFNSSFLNKNSELRELSRNQIGRRDVRGTHSPSYAHVLHKTFFWSFHVVVLQRTAIKRMFFGLVVAVAVAYVLYFFVRCRPGSHTVQWQNADHLQHLIDFLCQKDPKELGHFMDLCWKHG